MDTRAKVVADAIDTFLDAYPGTVAIKAGETMPDWFRYQGNEGEFVDIVLADFGELLGSVGSEFGRAAEYITEHGDFNRIIRTFHIKRPGKPVGDRPAELLGLDINFYPRRAEGINHGWNIVEVVVHGFTPSSFGGLELSPREWEPALWDLVAFRELGFKPEDLLGDKVNLEALSHCAAAYLLKSLE